MEETGSQDMTGMEKSMNTQGRMTLMKADAMATHLENMLDTTFLATRVPMLKRKPH